MGGPFVLRTAATFPDRVGAGATFHGGGLVTDKPDSPHLLIPKMKAHFLIAIAENDDKKQPEAKDVLRDSFAKAQLPAEIEVYAGTMHGWCPPDSQVYNHDQSEKAWSRHVGAVRQLADIDSRCASQTPSGCFSSVHAPWTRTTSTLSWAGDH